MTQEDSLHQENNCLPDAAIMARAGAHLQGHGYALIPGLVGASVCRVFADRLPVPDQRAGGARDPIGPDLAAHPAVSTLQVLASRLMRAPAHAVRVILFDKTPDSNWGVPWHQDLSIPVRERHELQGYGGWSRKQGVWHVQPPARVLERMLTLRLHLDDCGADNAPLMVLPATHNIGRLNEATIAENVERVVPVSCIADAGDVLAMRPSLLHASLKARSPAHRRVLHIEYAAGDLPAPLCWHEAYATA